MFGSTQRHTGVFRREPGDWPCRQCNEVNFRSRDACRRCATPRDPSTQTNAPQAVPRAGDWTCQFCNNLNFAARTACHKCARQIPVPMNVDAARPTIVPKPGDWKCPSCPETNFGSRVVCRSCNTARPSSESTTSKSECVICMEKPIDSVITTCGHSAMCLPCGNLVNQCPVCRSPYNKEQIIKMFNVHQ